MLVLESPWSFGSISANACITRSSRNTARTSRFVRSIWSARLSKMEKRKRKGQIQGKRIQYEIGANKMQMLRAAGATTQQHSGGSSSYPPSTLAQSPIASAMTSMQSHSASTAATHSSEVGASGEDPNIKSIFGCSGTDNTAVSFGSGRCSNVRRTKGISGMPFIKGISGMRGI